jgi:hypothetical protein
MTNAEQIPQGYTPPPLPYAPPSSSYAVISLVCGILAWLGVFGLGGLLAVIFGHLGKNEIRRSYGRVGGNNAATAGLVLGYTNIAIALMGCCFFVLIWMGILASPACLIPFMNNIQSNFTTIP